MPLEELRICKSCGNGFSRKTRVTIITEYLQCKETNFEPIHIEEGHSQE